MTRDQAIATIWASDLAAHGDALEAALRPSVILEAERLRGGTMAPAASRFGGNPALPRGVPWPTWDARPHLARAVEHQREWAKDKATKGLARCERDYAEAQSRGPRPLSFLAQVQLADLHGLDSGLALPARGLLSFFAELEHMTWGYDPADAGSYQVVYTENTDPLELLEVPHGPGVQRFETCRVSFSQGYSLPPSLTAVDGAVLDAEKAYHDLANAVTGETTIARHRIGGYPVEIQGDMTLECQLVSHGLYCGDSSGYRDPRAAELRAGAADWRLLLQLDSDEQVGWMWGDAGTLFFWIREQDVRTAHFAGAWAIQQCF